MEVLESHMTERLRLSSCLVNDVCLNSGDLSASTIRASAATSNSIAFEVAELSAKMATAREDVGRFKEDVEWVRMLEITHLTEGGQGWPKMRQKWLSLCLVCRTPKVGQHTRDPVCYCLCQPIGPSSPGPRSSNAKCRGSIPPASWGSL